MPLAQIAPPHPPPPPYISRVCRVRSFPQFISPQLGGCLSVSTDSSFRYHTTPLLFHVFSSMFLSPPPPPSSLVVLSRLRFTVPVCSPLPPQTSNISRYDGTRLPSSYVRNQFRLFGQSNSWRIRRIRREEKIPRNTYSTRTRCVVHILQPRSPFN